MKLTVHYLSYMLDLSTRETLSIMPQNLIEKPTSWDDIIDGNLWTINGQHNVKVEKVLQSSNLAEDCLPKLLSVEHICSMNKGQEFVAMDFKVLQ